MGVEGGAKGARGIRGEAGGLDPKAEQPNLQRQIVSHNESPLSNPLQSKPLPQLSSQAPILKPGQSARAISLDALSRRLPP